MNCRQVEMFFRENPGLALPPRLQSHILECQDCRALAEEQDALEAVLKSPSRLELPPYFQARLWARINRAESRTRSLVFQPARLSLAASVLMVAAGLLLLLRAPVPENIFLPQAVIQTPDQAPAPGNIPGRPEKTIASVDPEAGQPSQIYPVWPGEKDVAEGRDLNIVASFYPAIQNPDRIKVTIDDQPLASAQYQMKQDYLTIAPKNLGPGQHVVLVSLTDRQGRRTDKSWSFYLLEELS